MFVSGSKRFLLKLLIVVVVLWFLAMICQTTWQSQKFRFESLLGHQRLKLKLTKLLRNKLNTSSFFESAWESKRQSFLSRLNLTEPGAMGRGVELPKALPDDIKKLIDDGWHDYTINQFVSDLVPLRRSLPDIRGKYCKAQVYKNLPKASVIIIFHNEALSMLLRTIHSVLDRSPKNLLEEIMLIDDCSDRAHLQKPLEDYISKYPKVKLLRSPTRNGVMLSRMWGASNAKGPALVFIDCHMEVMSGYLEPLLDRIARNRNASAIPVIGALNRETLQFHYEKDPLKHSRHGFAWNMDHTWIHIPDYERKRHSDPWEPIYSVTMLGAMFSIHKDYFKELGMYDPNFDVYGAEDVELSFKVWLCGGVLEQVPCSQSAHMFREKFFYTMPKGRGGYRWNTDRLAEVWLGPYKKYYYKAVGDEKRNFGDISEQVAIREKCKPFDWLIKNVYPDIVIPAEKLKI